MRAPANGLFPGPKDASQARGTRPRVAARSSRRRSGFAWVCVLAGCASTSDAPTSPEPSEPTAEPEQSPPASPELPTQEAPTEPEASRQAPPPILRSGVYELELALSSHPTPAGAPDVVVSVPEGIDAADVPLTVFLHGWGGCARVLFHAEAGCRDGEPPQPGWGLAERHRASGHPSVFAVVQLSWRERSGDPGRFREPGFATEWFGALMEALGEAAGQTPRPGQITVFAHSAGYETALTLLGRLEGLDTVVLFDALYAGGGRFAEWVAGNDGRRLLTSYTGRRTTYREHRRLERHARDLLGNNPLSVDPTDPIASLRDHRIVIYESRFPHGAIPRRELQPILEFLRTPEDS
ncbi:MAG: hypothetical protein AAGF12_01805 [Myxococcota bacterium]